MPEIPPADVLLCERCGYRIGELSPDLPCPECGKPIAESLPERRTVYPTIWQTLTRPRWSLDHMRIDERGRRACRWRCAVAAALVSVVLVPLMMSLRIGIELKEQPNLFIIVHTLSIAWVPIFAYAAFRVLTQIEQIGLRHFGRRRGFRITSDLAACICGYGSAGWILLGFGMITGALLVRTALHETHPNRGELTLIAAGSGSVLGFLFFEVFAAMGMQRCRFANRPREGDGEGGREPANPAAAGGERAPGRPDTSPTIDHAATPTDATDPDR